MNTQGYSRLFFGLRVIPAERIVLERLFSPLHVTFEICLPCEPSLSPNQHRLRVTCSRPTQHNNHAQLHLGSTVSLRNGIIITTLL